MNNIAADVQFNFVLSIAPSLELKSQLLTFTNIAGETINRTIFGIEIGKR